MKETKICTVCRKEKELSEFILDNRKKSGFGSQCKDCRNRQQREWRLQNPEKVKKADKRHQLKQNYGMTVKEYDIFLQKQSGVCAICGKPESVANQWGILRLSVDHNHKTGRVRGLLCWKCNTMLGMARDNMDILLKGIVYLRRRG